MERLPGDIQYAIWKQVNSTQVLVCIREEAKKHGKMRAKALADSYIKSMREKRRREEATEATELFERVKRRVREGEGIRRERRMSAIGGGDGYISYWRLRYMMGIEDV